MKNICVPPTAASKKLHIGNLYNWILIDVYKKAKKLQGEIIGANETWNCYSQRLEENMRFQFPSSSNDELLNRCKEETEKSIEYGKSQIKRYGIIFDSPEIRDDSEEYSEFVKKYLEHAHSEGRILGTRIKMPPLEETLNRIREIEITPQGIEKRLSGAKTLEELKDVELFRKGSYGIYADGDSVYGQRFVQSLLPNFYFSKKKNSLVGIFGNDILTKWIYFMVANSSKIPFEQLAFSGMVLNQFGKKISKYDSNAPLLDTLEKFNPDCVRLGLLKQSFGKDFKLPRFEEEEKFRRKIFNCVRYLSNYSKVIEGCEGNYPNQRLKENYDKILRSLTSFRFREGYEGFRKFIYQQISKDLIEKTKLESISVGTKEEALRLIKNLGEMFIPKSLDDF